MNKKIKAIILTCFSIILFTFSSLTLSAKESTTDSSYLFTFKQISGTSANNLNDLFSTVPTHTKEPQLFDLQLYKQRDTYYLSGSLSCDNMYTSFNSDINLYKNSPTPNVALPNSLILGEVADSNDIHFVQFKLDATNSTMSLVIQLRDTKQLLYFIHSLDNNIFSSVSNSFQTTLCSEELEKKSSDLIILQAIY